MQHNKNKRNPQYATGYPLAFSLPICQYIDMVCPYCQSQAQVTNSRLQKRGNSVWRRRKCTHCGAIWTSVERSEPRTIWRVSKDKQILAFEPETLYISLYKALEHKKTAPTDAKYIYETVVQKLTAKHTAILPASLIIKTTYDILRRYDKVAAALYNATHTN